MSRKDEIVEALWRESDLPLMELAKSLGSDQEDEDDEEIRQDLRELVRDGVVTQKDSVDHDWLYRLSAAGILARPVRDTGEDPTHAQEIARDQSYRDWKGLCAMSDLFIVRLTTWLAGQDPSDYSESTREMLNAVLWESGRRGWQEGWWEDPSVVLERDEGASAELPGELPP